MFLVARGAAVLCGGSMLPFLATLATSSALLFMTLVVRQEQAIAGYCLGHQGPSTQDRRRGHGPFQEKAKYCVLIFCGFPG